MTDRLRSVLEADPRIAYAILFGSRGRGSAHDRSDTDVAVGLARGARLSVVELGDLLSRLETAAGDRLTSCCSTRRDRASPIACSATAG